MSGEFPNLNLGKEQPSTTRIEIVERAIEGLVKVAKTQGVEKRQVPQPNPEERIKPTTVAKFYKQNRGNKSGKADHWMIDMERIFRVSPCTDEQKILFATNTLKGEALHRWNTQLGPNAPTT